METSFDVFLLNQFKTTIKKRDVDRNTRDGTF